MKIGRHKPARFESGPNMTPLVDVVMVILIFLMLVGTFASGEWYLQQNATTFNTGTSSTPPPKDFVPDEPIYVRVTYRSEDQYIAQADRVSTSDRRELEAQLTAMRVQLEAIGTSLDKKTVVIIPQPNVKHRQYMEVYEAVLAAGFKKVSFAVTQ